jgi:hypothetical protein
MEMKRLSGHSPDRKTGAEHRGKRKDGTWRKIHGWQTACAAKSCTAIGAIRQEKLRGQESFVEREWSALVTNWLADGVLAEAKS